MSAPASDPASDPATGPPGDASGGPTVGQQLRYRVLIAGIWLLCRAPERPLLAVADLIGDIWYRLGKTRRARGRRNLGRVTRWMAEHEVGSDRGRLAGRDPRVLERLVRDAFRQSVRYNLILARGSTMDARYVNRWVANDTPEVLEAALAEPAGALFVGLHMGSMELPALYLSKITGRLSVAPTETLRDPLFQAHMVRARLRLGLRLVELSVAKREMTAALRRGDPVGIVGDRDLTGGGIEVPFFGAPSSLPVGPALLALETGVIPHVFGVRRTPDGVYHLTIVRVPFPEQGTRRERVTAYLAAEARAFERMVALAPEQWFAVFFDLWKDGAP